MSGVVVRATRSDGVRLTINCRSVEAAYKTLAQMQIMRRNDGKPVYDVAQIFVGKKLMTTARIGIVAALEDFERRARRGSSQE